MAESSIGKCVGTQRTSALCAHAPDATTATHGVGARRSSELLAESWVAASTKKHKPDFHKIFHVATQAKTSSDSELERILQEYRSSSRSTALRELHDARRARYDLVKTTLRVERVNGGFWDWHLVNPNEMVPMLVAESEGLQRLFWEKLQVAPCSLQQPWNLVVAFDEFVPGNKLQLQPGRKGMNVAFTFLELGSEDMSEEGNICNVFFF